MCEAAEDMQSHFKVQSGDRVYLKADLYADEDKLTAVPVEGQPLIFSEGLYYVNNPEEIGIKGKVHDSKTFLMYSIFVPYQEQLQERVLKNCNNDRAEMLRQFNAMALTMSYNQPLVWYYTLDEVWLMLYYFVVHEKEWAGDRWVETEVQYAAKVYANN